MLNVGVIMGGNSSEREVSLLTGQEFIKHLNRERYHVIEITIDKPKDVLAYANQLDFALLALHGKNGEDGKVQALLEALDIPYSGSGITSSALCMDKNMSKLLIQSVGLSTPKWVMVRKGLDISPRIFKGLQMPVIIKPNQGGSSLGINIANDYNAIIKGLENAYVYDDDVIVEEYIVGQEITCSMINGDIIPVISIKPRLQFYDFEEKYHENDEIQQLAQLEEAQLLQIKKTARICWDLFKLKAYARIDMMLYDTDIMILEINTLPGMTPYSHLPKSAMALGISYSQMLDRIIEDSMSPLH